MDGARIVRVEIDKDEDGKIDRWEYYGPDQKIEKGDDDKKARAKKVGTAIAEKCKEKGIDKVVFDRAGYKYHGRVSALAAGAREAGLKF